MKLSPEDKFFIEDGDGNLVLVTEFDIDPNMIKNNFLSMKGYRYPVDYFEDEILKDREEVEITISFTVEGIYGKKG